MAAATLAPAATLPVPGGGALVLRDDARLSEDRRLEAWSSGFGGSPVDADPADPWWKAVAAAPLAKAHLTLLDASGATLADEPLEQPLAKLEVTALPGLPPTWSVTEDYSAGMGSFNGPITRFVQVQDGHLVWLQATGDGPPGPVALMRSLRTEWRLAPPADLLHVAARPDGPGGDFVVHYSRLYYQDGALHRRTRTVEGDQEFESAADFPTESEFPPAF